MLLPPVTYVPPRRRLRNEVELGAMSVELSRLFSLMDGIQADDLFAGMVDQVQDLPGPSGVETASGAEEDAASGGTGPSSIAALEGGDKPLSPRTLYRIHQPPTIERGSCTKICPASSSSPKYKFVVPNDFVAQYMQHLVEKPFQLVDGGEKYEYMIQGWRRYGEDMQVMEGDTVQFRMVSIIKRGAAARAKGLVDTQPPMAGGSVPTDSQGHASTQQAAAAAAQLTAQQAQLAAAAHAAQAGQLAAAEQLNGAMPGAPDLLALIQQQQELVAQQEQEVAALQAQAHELGMQQAAAAAAAAAEALRDDGPGAGGRQQHPAAGVHSLQPVGGLAMAAVIEQLSKRQRLNEPAGGSLGGGSAGGGMDSVAQPSHITQQQTQPQQFLQAAVTHQLLQQAQDGAPPGFLAQGGAAAPPVGAAGTAPPPMAGGGGEGSAGGRSALPLLSDVADFDALLQENMALREELRLAQAKVATLESGVLNIRAVLTKNSDPGLIAITGVLNLVNHIEQTEFLPELSAEGRAALSSACAEIRRHLSSVVKMCWLLRECTD
eukprot:scaffold20.g7676.t1